MDSRRCKSMQVLELEAKLCAWPRHEMYGALWFI